jgi:dipeptidyl aminopeptidase/acylaminoacyl peptidase
MEREEAYRQVQGAAISDARDRDGNGGAFYQYCRQTGTWPWAVSGWDPLTEAERFHPFMAVKNVSATYPPTCMVHGDQDTDVPYAQSVMMAAEFKKHNVPHELISVPDGEHGLAGVEDRIVDSAYRKAFAFIDQYLRQ